MANKKGNETLKKCHVNMLQGCYSKIISSKAYRAFRNILLNVAKYIISFYKEKWIHKCPQLLKQKRRGELVYFWKWCVLLSLLKYIKVTEVCWYLVTHMFHRLLYTNVRDKQHSYHDCNMNKNLFVHVFHLRVRK